MQFCSRSLIGVLLLVAGSLWAPTYSQDCKGKYRDDGSCDDTPPAVQAKSKSQSDISKLAAAIKNERKALPLQKDTFNYFDLNIEGVCGPNGFSNEADSFLAGAANYFILQEQRAVALTFTVTEDGKNTKENSFEVPVLVARPDANNGRPTVNCGRALRSNYHRNTTIKLQFNFYVSKEKYQIPTVTGKLTKFLVEIFSLSSKPFVAGVTTAADVKLFLGDIDKITSATNELLQAFEKKTDDTVIIDIIESEGGVQIPVGKKSSIKIVKSLKDTILFSGPTYKGGHPGAPFKNVTGQDLDAVTTSLSPDGSKLGDSASDGDRRKECARIRGRYGDFVMGDDLLLLVHSFVAPRAPLFTGHDGYNCIEAYEARRMRDQVKLTDPYPGAYEQAIAQETRVRAARTTDERRTFDRLVVRLEGLAVHLKNLWLVRTAVASEKNQARANGLRTAALNGIGAFFDDQVFLDGGSREPLFTQTSSKVTAEELTEKLYAAPQITRVGCILPIVNQSAKNEGFVAEFLVRAETAPPAILHLQVKPVIKGEGIAIGSIWVGKLGRAKDAFAAHFKTGCGESSPYWFPWKEVDDSAVAEDPNAREKLSLRGTPTRSAKLRRL